MNFQLAKALAEETARGVAEGASTCPLEKTGLIVLVHGGEPDDGLDKVAVSAGGAAGKTDENGLARYIPIAPKEYTVHATRPENRDDLIEPEDVNILVSQGQCPVCVLHMPKGVKPEITILWAHDDSAVGQAQVQLVKSGAPAKPTNEHGVAAIGKLVPVGPYDLQVTFQDGHKYVLFEGNSPVTSVAVQGDGRKTLKIKRRTVEFHLVQQVGAGAVALEGAKVKLKEPAIEGTTALADTKAVTKLVVPVVKPDQKDVCEVDSLTPDGSDAAFEVLEVTS
jgi:DUF971 family protein